MQISVIIPVYNGGEDFRICLDALRASSLQPGEIIVVDDGCTDSSPALARQAGARVMSTSRGQSGPAVARNLGAAAAQGEILVFIDADVAVHADTLQKIQQIFLAHPEITALFGSYDDHPAKPGLVSQYKNLQHHYVHQNGRREASTFWGGLGAVRQDAFLRLQGFKESYSRPSIEDIEFGLRLSNAGYRVWLCPDVQATHLKQWTFTSLLRTDIFNRAIPWTELILSSGHLPADLNLNQANRLSVIAAWLGLALIFTGFIFPAAWCASLVAASAIYFLNQGFYRLVFARRGTRAMLAAFGLHALYFLYSSAVFVLLLIRHLIRKERFRSFPFARNVDTG